MYVYIQIAIYWLDPPNTDKKQICLQICGIGGGCRIAEIASQWSNPWHQGNANTCVFALEVASHIISVNRSFSS